MSNVFFTADPHYYHKNIMKYSNRPFKTVNEMNECMIDNWNSVVGKGDTVYLLGDFMFAKTPEEIVKIIEKLSGTTHLILGNHDRVIRKNQSNFYKYFNTISIQKEIKIKDQKIILNHNPMLSWNCSHFGSWMLCGHHHGSFYKVHPDHMENGLCVDVGVDVWDFTPVSFETIKELMEKKKQFIIDNDLMKSFGIISFGRE